MKSNDIRQKFFSFFENKAHKIVSSAPMVIKNDPTLMFTNAGMNQFKDIFLGNKPAKYNRIADTQKCLRVSGKHNDLEEVGHDTYHHTMFEMLGNWSFGDYFKKNAIHWACEFLIKEMGLDKSRMYATVFEGCKEDGVEFDQEAYDLWKEILPESQIIKGNKKDNFWEMGETGPCGPCSELHYDVRNQSEIDKIHGSELVNMDNPLVIEIWNLVFMQYNRKATGELELLPSKHVDTGMGFERLCMIVQGKKSNYDTDVFQVLIKKLSDLSSIKYGENEKSDIAMRVISDHLRAISFSIADGQIPSNVKAGYVIRRILRRAVRYGYTYLKFREPFICRMVNSLSDQMGDTFPELKAQEAFIAKIIEEEENSFLRTLSTGINMLDGLIDGLKKDNKNELDGKDAFVLYDTYGFPLDLTELICKENNIVVGVDLFKEELQKQKERSRNAATVETMDWVEVLECSEPLFLGYDKIESDCKISRYRTIVSKNKTQYQIVLTQTPFYGNSGGQAGEIGRIYNSTEIIDIVNTIKENGLIIHIANKLPKDPHAKFVAEVNLDNRKASASNHTATHLLHTALRTILGNHVEQKGSMVNANILRFDFSHYQKLSTEEINEAIRLVNKEIRSNHKCIENRDCPIDEAKNSGAMMLFGEKYDETVRTIGFGDSFELCGGIHAKRTGDLGGFTILSEKAISAGIRRVEAITGAEKIEIELLDKNTIQDIQSLFNTKSILDSIEKIIQNNSELNKKVEILVKEKNDILKEKIKSMLVEKEGVLWYVSMLNLPVNELKDIASILYGELSNIVFIVSSIHENKPSLLVMFGKDCVTKGGNAGAIIKSISKMIQGGGGGQPHIASAGGKDSSQLDEALNSAKNLAEEMLKS